MKNFQKLDEILLKISHCIIESTWKALLESPRRPDKNFQLFEKWYKNWEFQVWLQLKGTKNTQKASELWKNKKFANYLQKNSPFGMFIRWRAIKELFWVFQKSEQQNIQKRWHSYRTEAAISMRHEKIFFKCLQKIGTMLPLS